MRISIAIDDSQATSPVSATYIRPTWETDEKQSQSGQVESFSALTASPRAVLVFLSIPFLSLSSYSSLFSTSEKLPRLREPASFTLSRARELNKFETRERRDDLVSFPRILVYFSDVLGFARTVWAYGSKLIYAAWNWHDR